VFAEHCETRAVRSRHEQRNGRPRGDTDEFFDKTGLDSSSTPIFQAVQQLGLKLQARKAPFDTIVIDHLERTPSDNLL
jgi:uncharacterized protein (TIGR03435 family)